MKPTFVFVFLLLFHGAAIAGPKNRLTIGVFADINGTECQPQYPTNSQQGFDQLLNSNNLDQIIMTGDAVHGECLSYKGTIPYQNVVNSMWAEFDNKFLDRARKEKGISLILAPGNHDAPFLTSSSRETFRAENAEFVRYWQNLKPHLGVEPIHIPGVADNFPYYWAYFYENVLFVVLQSTSTHSLSNGKEQKRWLKAVLQSPQAKSARARIAFGHIPPYPVLDPSVGGKYLETIEKEQVGNPDSLMDLLLDKGVDLLLVGHSHAPYPAELTRTSDEKKIKIISMPCAHSPRKLFSKDKVAPRGYVLFELTNSNQIDVSIRNWSDGKPIPTSYFPELIPMKDNKVTYRRMDDYLGQ